MLLCRWDLGFVKGLAASAMVVPLISYGSQAFESSAFEAILAR